MKIKKQHLLDIAEAAGFNPCVDGNQKVRSFCKIDDGSGQGDLEISKKTFKDIVKAALTSCPRVQLPSQQHMDV